MWRGGIEQQDEVLRIANDMRVHQEALPAIAGQPLASCLWDLYYDRLVRANDRDRFFTVLRPEDHLASFQWLFRDYAHSESNKTAYVFMLAQLQERSGAHTEALANYRSLASQFTAQGARSGSMVEEVQRAIRRLQGR
jgi:hypothetical protein